MVVQEQSVAHGDFPNIIFCTVQDGSELVDHNCSSGKIDIHFHGSAIKIMNICEF